MSAKDRLHHHLAAFGAGDRDEVRTAHTEEPVLITPIGTTKGLAALREAVDGFFSEQAD